MKDISLHLMDIVQNSIVAGADRIVIKIKVISTSNSERLSHPSTGDQKERYILLCEIIDNGIGMDSDFAKVVVDPFKTSRTTREIGLGLPLLKQSAEMAGGELILESEPNRGTTVKAYFYIDHIDRIPLGDISGTIKILIMANPNLTWVIEFSSYKNEFILDTSEVKQQLGEVPLNNNDVLNWIEKTVDEGIKMVFGGVLDEVR